jgi:hypothetical protein
MTLEELARKFAQLVQITSRDMGQLQARIAVLEAQLQQAQARGGFGDTEIQRGTAGTEVVGYHPVTGKPITANEVDPKLAMRLRFSEED